MRTVKLKEKKILSMRCPPSFPLEQKLLFKILSAMLGSTGGKATDRTASNDKDIALGSQASTTTVTSIFVAAVGQVYTT